MKRTLKIAVVQMDANPSPIADRLARAERLAVEAAAAGAQLVVLPELFNTGYGYSNANYRLAEPLSGPTAAWMEETVTRLDIHLAGTLMLLDHDEVYNALLLFAPDGRMWRYDKNYPWGWERGYFRDGNRITVAETDVGDCGRPTSVGLMICWDVAHPELWRRYAGRVDVMVICSCPPDVSNPTYHFPNGDTLTFDDMGPLMASIKGSARLVFGDTINQQTAWLGVPAVNTVGSGYIRTAIPNGLGTFLTFLPAAPWLIKYLPQANRMQMSCAMTQGCKVVDASGQVLVELAQEQGETFAIAEVALADEKPQPRRPQPRSPVPFITYLSSDVLLPSLTVPVYRKGLRRAWGKEMAPIEASTRKWRILLGLGATVGFLLGVCWGRWKKRRRS
jgi:hypothetical protein